MREPHGHNYRVLVTLAGAELDASGLLLDFKLLKNLLKPVVEYLDHQMINDLAPFLSSPVGGEPGAVFLRRDVFSYRL